MTAVNTQTQVTTQTYILRKLVVEDRTYPGGKSLIDEKRCFVTGGLEDPHWVCREYHEYVHLKGNYLIISKHYLNCTQANKVKPEENPQFVLCSTSVLEYVYELVPVSMHELIEKMRKIAENTRIFRSVLAGKLLYAVRIRDRLYVLEFAYNPILNCTRSEVKYVVPA